MVKTQDIIKDLQELRGAQVRIFGQETTLSADVDHFTIDTIEILEALEGYEVTEFTTYEEDEDGNDTEVDLFEGCEDADGAIDILIDYGYCKDEWRDCNNTYNWSAPVTNHLNWYVYDDMMQGGVYIEVKAHRFGDVRCNYTDEVLYHFRNYDEFLEVIFGCNKYESIEIDGKWYSIEVNALSDGFEVYDNEGDCIGTAYGYDEGEIIECIREKNN